MNNPIGRTLVWVKMAYCLISMIRKVPFSSVSINLKMQPLELSVLSSSSVSTRVRLLWKFTHHVLVNEELAIWKALTKFKIPNLNI